MSESQVGSNKAFLVQEDEDMILRRQVLYIGTSVPASDADSLESLQQPLADRYPLQSDGRLEGILTHLAVMNTGLTLQHLNDPEQVLFFPYSCLSLCGALRCVNVVSESSWKMRSIFVPISSTLSKSIDRASPTIFTVLTRRTDGRRFLECHAFVCHSTEEALELTTATSNADQRWTEQAYNAPTQEYRHFRAPFPRYYRSEMVDPYSEMDIYPRYLPPAPPLVFDRNGLPPEYGYFYTTKESQVKMYAMDHLMGNETGWGGQTPAIMNRQLGMLMNSTAQPSPMTVLEQGGGGGALPPTRMVMPGQAYSLPPPSSVMRQPAMVVESDPYDPSVPRAHSDDPETTRKSRHRHRHHHHHHHKQRKRSTSGSSSSGSHSSSNPDYSFRWSPDRGPARVQSSDMKSESGKSHRSRKPGRLLAVSGERIPTANHPPEDQSKFSRWPFGKFKSKEIKGKKVGDEDNASSTPSVQRHYSKQVKRRVVEDESDIDELYATLKNAGSPQENMDFLHVSNKFNHEKVFARGISMGAVFQSPWEDHGDALNDRMAQRAMWLDNPY